MPTKTTGSQQQKDKEVALSESFKGSVTQIGSNKNGKEGNVNLKFIAGPTEEELDGLDLEERKRKRIGLSDRMDVEGIVNATQSDAGLSKIDCSESSTTFLAKLAKQASHPQ
ncbi:hypothetical protein AgCh_029416 [Apium graveolens]